MTQKQAEQALFQLIPEPHHDKARQQLDELLSQVKTQAEYQGQCKTLERLGIEPLEWDQIKQGKQNVKLVKAR